MPLIDVIEQKDIDAFGNWLMAAIDKLKENIEVIRDDTEVEVIIKFKKRQKDNG